MFLWNFNVVRYKMNIFLRLFFIALIHHAFAQIPNPLEDPTICGNPVCKGSGKFKYGPGTQQNYKYSVEVRSLFNGTSKNESTLYMEGDVSLNFLTPCDGLLTLSDIKLSENIPRDGEESPQHDNSNKFAEMISEFSLRFSFKDGVIDELCPQDEEKNWVLNFKRGVLSMLHNSMKRFDLDYSGEEEDVRGKCMTTYNVLTAKETSLLIEKTKDLKSCTGNSKLHSIVQSTPYSFQPKNKDTILKSSASCILSVDHNIYNEIQCQEKHVLQPFSNGDAGATTTVHQKLVLIYEELIPKNRDEESEITRREPLVFNHVLSAKPTHGELKESRELMKKLCKQSNDDLQIEFSDLFSKLIHTLRVLSYSALSALYSHSKSTCATGTKHLLDALPYVNSAASVTLMKDIILRGRIPENTVDEWVMSMAFIARPDKDILEAASQLLQPKSFNSNIALSVSSLAHTYCMQNSKCEDDTPIQTITIYLENHVRDLYERSNLQDRYVKDNIIVTLKALSNIGVISGNFQEELFKIIDDFNLDMAIRVAAVETFRRLPCEQTRSHFQHIFRNQNEDAELRIMSYLQIMRCPNYLLIRTIKHSLEQEEVNQVGSFVWTHLNNILKTSVPTKVEIQSLLSEKDLVKKFSSDVRKFSHNREGSLYFDEYNIGANYESNVIFSPSSYIPKSAMLNLTVDLFGESVNLFEVYGRAEGFEHYLEKMFGHYGPLHNIKDTIAEKLRVKRDVSDNEIRQGVDKLPNILNDRPKEPKVSLGLKVFGNELKYKTYKGDEEIVSALRTLHPVDHLKHILSGKEINYNKATMFLDSNYIIPSGAGLPISLNAIGTASVNLKLHGSLHTAGPAKNKEIDLTADIQPTVSIDITGEMAVDAFYASTGIKLKTNMYTASAVKGVIKIRGPKMVSVQFNILRQNTEILGAKSELLVKQHDVEEKQGGLLTNRVSESICSWSSVDKTVGLKLCADYHFINVTKINNAPFFLFAGPAGFRWYLNKTDPTAKTYLFEYKWTQGKDLSVISFSFDTPDSSIRRLLSANLTIDKQTQNLTMLMQSSAGIVLCKGRMKNTDDEKYLEVALDINDKKHFDARMSMFRKEIRNGYIYYPKAYLGVNDERVLELQGTVDYLSKNDVAQYGVDLKFETKRLKSKLFGYISKKEMSLGVDLNLDYKFVNIKEQRVELKFSISNKSRKNFGLASPVTFAAVCSLNSTAYPNYNFNTNATFLKKDSHVELNVHLVQNPLPDDHPDAEDQRLTFHWNVVRKAPFDKPKILSSVATVKRISSNLDLKAMISLETAGPEINLATSVKYGNNKEVAARIFWSHQKAPFTLIKTHVNITVPSFTPLNFKLEALEKQSNTWMIHVNGTWFSGHTMSARGLYQAESKALSSSHHIKLYLKSPNFQDINIDLQFYRDNDVLKLDLKANQLQNDYLFYFEHNNLSPVEVNTKARIKYKAKLYTLNSSYYNGNYTKATVELRFDQIRDIHFSIWGYNQEASKAAGFEVKWDANRDPNQKLMVTANFTKVAPFNYKADLIIGYPTRTILGKYEFLFEKGHLNTLISLSWDDDRTFAIKLNVNYDYENRVYLEIFCTGQTPFDDWRLVSVQARFNHQHNLYDFQSRLVWNKHQKISLDLYGNYKSTDNQFNCEYKCALRSTLKSVPNSMMAHLTHFQNYTDFMSDVHLMYNPEFVVNVTSNWNVLQNNKYTNLTGTVITTTPFSGLNKGILVSKIYLTNNKYIRGVADLDLDHKKVTVDLEGKYRKLTDSMLTVNITTPDEDYQLRYLLSMEQRHFVALLTYPTGMLGTEILFSFHSLSNFDVKFLLGTPVEFLQYVIIVGKLKPGEADFRLGWNFLVVGFSGVWHYVNVTDFEYSYKIYTPIEDFEENGIVGKLIFKEGLDFEVSIKLSNYKLGVKLLGKPKPKTLKELGIKIEDIYGKSTRQSVDELDDVGGDADDDDDDYDEDDEDPLSWEGLIELDAIIYPTMKGKLEIDQKGDTYILQSKLTLPHGIATVMDEFQYISLFNMKNKLRVSTPYQSFKAVVSDFNLNIQPEHNYIIELNFDYENGTRVIKTGIVGKYIMNINQKEKSYSVTLKVNSPFERFPKLEVLSELEIEENFYRTNLLFSTNKSYISLDATAEANKVGVLEVNGNILATTPAIKVPQTNIKVKKFFSSFDNYLDASVSVPAILKSDINFKSSWLVKAGNQFRVIVQLETPFNGMENSTVGIDVKSSMLESTAWAAVHLHPIAIQVDSRYANNVLHVSSNLDFNGKIFPLIIKCNVMKPNAVHREFDGTLTLREQVFKISGNADMDGYIPAKLLLVLTHEDNQTIPLRIEYELKPSTAFKGYELEGSLKQFDRLTQFNAQATVSDKFNWEFNLQIQPQQGKKILVNAKASPGENNKKNILITAQTPLMKLENPKLRGSITPTEYGANLDGSFELTQASGSFNLELILHFMENMYIDYVGKYINPHYTSQSTVVLFYRNPKKVFHHLSVGGDLKIDRLWEAASNLTLDLPSTRNIGIEGHIKLPDNPKETQSVYGKLNYAENMKVIQYLAKYRTDLTNKKYGSVGDIHMEERKNLTGNVEIEWKGLKFNNFANLKLNEKKFDFVYKLKTPKYADRQLFIGEINYVAGGQDLHHVKCEAFYPESQSVAFATIDYKEIANMKGMFNLTMPYRNLNYTGAFFQTKTNAAVYNRYVKVFWHNNTAIFDGKCDIKTGVTLLDRTTTGNLIIELPLATRHVTHINYEYHKKEKISQGHAIVKYNGDQVLEGKYNCLLESRAGLDKDTIHVELENKMVPLGAQYVHRHEYSAPGDGYNVLSVDRKYLHLFNLHNQTKFNLSGQFDVTTTPTGQKYALTAIHLKRAVKLLTDYDILDQEYKQHSRIELSPTTWLEYDLNLLNKTEDEIFDVQEMQINVFYPLRNFTALGSYNISDSTVSTNVSLMYDKDKINRIVEAGFDWRRTALHREELQLKIKHPSFERDVVFQTDYGYNKTSIDGRLIVNYSLSREQTFTLTGVVSDQSDDENIDYVYILQGEHPATNLYLNSNGKFYYDQNGYGTEHYANYKRSYIPLRTEETCGRINFQTNEIELKRNESVTGLSRFWGRYGGNFPVYTANISATHGINDSSGEFYLNLRKKLLYLNLNMTADGTQSLHAYGIIPDARSALMDIWRNYDEKTISDLSYFLKLNHSRLIMSRLKWRPDLITDLQHTVRGRVEELYLEFLDNLNNTRQYVRSEMVEAIKGIWDDSESKCIHFLHDLRNLTVIEDDFEQLKKFLNKSYHANEFYMKDIATVVMTMFDELALKSHIQSLPKIVSEIWDVMGESGQKIKNSILWAIEKIKIYYKNTTDFIHSLINGNPVEHLSNVFKQIVEKWDDFIKNIHVSFIRNMEKLWATISTLVVDHWHKLLATVEPTFLKVIHYLETIFWNTSKELLDFLYIRKTELIESPYFAKFTHFSQDIDRFYKDITGNNTVASIYKYSKIAWDFLEEKYLNHVPFAKELQDILNEVLSELSQLKNIPSIKYLIGKYNEGYEYVKYYYTYFNVESRLHKLFSLIYMKLSDMSVTALEQENRQREAKTKFIFETADGIMLLEQKLPMSWHAFNETPKFQEIPEIKAIFDLKNYFTATGRSFWDFYYEFKPYTDPSEWLPPFKGQAMLVGSKYYVTFDKSYYNFLGTSCTYLLARDFLDRNFTLLVSYDDIGQTNELILLLEDTVVRINVFKDEIKIGGGSARNRLPLAIGDTYVYRNADIVTVHSTSGFILECNMRFHICMFEMSGWYFGKTAGLWGTLNNEPSDDLLTASKQKSNRSEIESFTRSWALESSSCSSKKQFDKAKSLAAQPPPPPHAVSALCEEFFTNKVSQLSSCFARVPKEPYYSMCMDSKSEQGACMSAVAYINICKYANTPLYVPDTCVKCNLLNGSIIDEGDFIRLEGNSVPDAADVVFIVEAKACNKDLRNIKNVDILIDSLEKELLEKNVTDNRYSLVSFGGSNVFDEPRSIVLNGKTFTDSKNILSYFDNIEIGEGNVDIFNAIAFASNLFFRPGASRTFILLPCSECQEYDMERDWSTIHQLLFHNAVSFHILMNDPFQMQKERDSKSIFGFDKLYAYTRKDVKQISRDSALRKLTSSAKSKLGVCSKLSQDNNGLIFSGKYLETDRKNAKKISSVFAKRVASSAVPNSCVDCECTASETGVSFMECYRCTSPRVNVERLFEDDSDAFGSLQLTKAFSELTSDN